VLAPRWRVDVDYNRDNQLIPFYFQNLKTPHWNAPRTTFKPARQHPPMRATTWRFLAGRSQLRAGGYHLYTPYSRCRS